MSENSVTLTRETTWDILADVAVSLTYKDGYRFKFYKEDGWQKGTFSIYHITENSIDIGETRSTDHNFIVPMATYDAANWQRWIFDRIAAVDDHERCEFFKVNNKRVYAPHHGNGEDPYYVWHLGTQEQIDKSPGDD